MILGNSLCALDLAEELLGMGIEVIIVSRDLHCDSPSLDSKSDKTNKIKPEILLETRLLSCQGIAGDFKVHLEQNEKEIFRNAANIVIAENYRRESNFSLYNLEPSEDILSLSGVMENLNNRSKGKNLFSKGKKVSFFTGLTHESNPLIHEEIMGSCLKLQSDLGVQTYVFTKNLKVAGEGLDTLYKKTREAGTIYIKLTDTLPEVHQDQNGRRLVAYYDEVTRQKCRSTTDIIVVDETICSSVYHQEIGPILNIDRDHLGFLQTDNVHRYSVFTNRTGIFAVGPSRAILSPTDQITGAQNAAIHTIELLAGQYRRGDGESAVIDPGSCVRCLTCYRLCPYHAIFINSRPCVERDACEGCGICAAECPRGAITLGPFHGIDLFKQAKEGTGLIDKQDFIPRIAAFCCSRSSIQAMEVASCLGYELLEGMDVIEVPCAGNVSIEDILGAFKSNYDGVLVLTCHKGNCHSERGHTLALGRIDHTGALLARIGLEKERLHQCALASNMGREFAEICKRFRDRLLKLGPTRLRR